MKSLLIAAILIGTLLTGLLEQTKLVRLKQENKLLESAHVQEAEIRKQSNRGRRILLEKSPKSLKSTLDEAESIELRSRLNHALGLAIHIGSGGPMETAAIEALLRFFDGLAHLNHKDAFRLIEDIKKDPSLNGPLQQDPGMIHRMFAEINAREAMLLALSIEDPKERDDLLKNSFRFWLQQDIAAAREWLEKESANTVSPKTRKKMIERLVIAYARIDPDLALELASSELSDLDPKQRESLGEEIADPHLGLRNPDEHLTFLAALKRAEKSKPGDLLISQIRTRYVYGLCMDLDRWPFEEMIKLIDTEFLPEEKQAIIRKLAHLERSPDSKKWNDWLTKNKFPANTLKIVE